MNYYIAVALIAWPMIEMMRFFAREMGWYKVVLVLMVTAGFMMLVTGCDHLCVDTDLATPTPPTLETVDIHGKIIHPQFQGPLPAHK